MYFSIMCVKDKKRERNQFTENCRNVGLQSTDTKNRYWVRYRIPVFESGEYRYFKAPNWSFLGEEYTLKLRENNAKYTQNKNLLKNYVKSRYSRTHSTVWKSIVNAIMIFTEQSTIFPSNQFTKEFISRICFDEHDCVL